MLGVWGIESAFGDPVVEKNHMRPVIPSLATLAWGEPRRRAYWEQELINALMIVQRGWAHPNEMIGSWAGAMGHTQWMPEVWLHVGIDYNGDGRISPFGAAGRCARLDRALFRRTRQLPARRTLGLRSAHAGANCIGHGSRSYAAWQALGVARADGEPYPRARRHGTALDPRSGRAGFPARRRISLPRKATIRR